PVDIDYWHDIIVVLNRGRGTARDRSYVCQDLALPGTTAKNRKVSQIIQGMHVVLWHLGIRLITNAVAWVDPKIWGGLFRSRKRAEHALGYTLRGDAEDRCHATIYPHIQLQHIVWLLNSEIHRTCNMADLFHEITRELKILCQVGSGYLNINWRRQPKV